MEDGYSRERMDRISEDVAVTRSKVEAMERLLTANMSESRETRERLGKVERRVFALWVLGPIVGGAVAILQSLKVWITEH